MDGYFSIREDNKLLDPQIKEDVDIIKTSMESLEFEKWRSCCDEARKCCSQVMSKAFVERIFLAFFFKIDQSFMI
jgi:hypothetical protein